MLKQDRNSPVAVELQVAIIYAVTADLLSTLPVERVGDFESFLFEQLENHHGDVLATIRDTGVLAPETETALREAITTALDRFAGRADA